MSTPATVPHVSPEEAMAHNRTAAALSVIPGAGHLYKGYVLTAVALFFLGVPLTLGFGALLFYATLGFSLFLPLLYWALVMVFAYMAEDRRHEEA